MELFGDAVVSNLTYFDQKTIQGEDDFKAIMTLYLPHPQLSESKGVLRSNNDRCFCYINRRPVDLPRFTKLINAHIRKHFNGNSISFFFIFEF
jgi:DNA mismatch repair ATPase MutL